MISKAQFCAAFYHVHEWGQRSHYCLDEENCIIAKRAAKEAWNVQPKEVFALVKFEDNKGNLLYRKTYSSCSRPQKKHAEDFFKDDVESGELANLIEDNVSGKITMYMTYQPCNRSVSLTGTCGTPANKSCCDTLRRICNKKLHPNIRLCIKVTHLYRVYIEPATGRTKNEQEENEIRRKRAIEGVQNLMQMDNVTVEHMTQQDWNYLSGLTSADVTEGNEQRQELDASIEQTLTHITPHQQAHP